MLIACIYVTPRAVQFPSGTKARPPAAAGAAGAVQAPQPAKPQREEEIAGSMVGPAVSFLSEPFLGAERMHRNAEGLHFAMPRDIKKDRAYWSTFERQVQTRLALFASAEPWRLASLCYNLENALDVELKDDPYIRVIHVAAITALKQMPRERQMTLESVLLEAQGGQMGMPLLATWLKSRRVNEEDVTRAFEKLPAGKLRAISDSQTIKKIWHESRRTC